MNIYYQGAIKKQIKGIFQPEVEVFIEKVEKLSENKVGVSQETALLEVSDKSKNLLVDALIGSGNKINKNQLSPLEETTLLSGFSYALDMPVGFYKPPIDDIIITRHGEGDELIQVPDIARERDENYESEDDIPLISIGEPQKKGFFGRRKRERN